MGFDDAVGETGVGDVPQPRINDVVSTYAVKNQNTGSPTGMDITKPTGKVKTSANYIVNRNKTIQNPSSHSNPNIPISRNFTTQSNQNQQFKIHKMMISALLQYPRRKKAKKKEKGWKRQARNTRVVQHTGNEEEIMSELKRTACPMEIDQTVKKFNTSMYPTMGVVAAQNQPQDQC